MAGDVGESYIAAMESSDASVGRATTLIVISAVSFGSISVLTVLTTGTGLPLLTVMAWRYVLGALLLAPFAKPLASRAVRKRQIIQLLLIGGFGQALITYLSLYSLRYIAVGPLAFLFYTYPAWVAAIAALRGTERLTLTRIVALLLALIGVTVMVGAPVERLNPVGVALALGSALLYSVYLPALEYVQEGIPAMPATFLLILGAAATFVVAGVVAGEAFVPRGTAVWANIGLLAVVSTVVAFSALIKGLSVLGPVRTAIIATVEPFFTAVLGLLVLGNQLGIATIAGGVFIALAIVVIEWSSTRHVAATA